MHIHITIITHLTGIFKFERHLRHSNLWLHNTPMYCVGGVRSILGSYVAELF